MTKREKLEASERLRQRLAEGCPDGWLTEEEVMGEIDLRAEKIRERLDSPRSWRLR